EANSDSHNPKQKQKQEWTADAKIRSITSASGNGGDDALEAGVSQVVTARSTGPTLRSIPKVEKSANAREIEMWESALQSPSPAIRRQALRMLKQLTGRDYGV